MRVTVLIVIIAVTLSACGTTTPTQRLMTLADNSGLHRSEIRAGGYDLLLLENNKAAHRTDASTELPQSRLHVYLEGDGSPWKYRYVIMTDPTPRNPLMLRLMGQDDQPAVYLGRPCYNGSYASPGCHHRLWTSGRYSREVIDTMASAIRVLSKQRGISELWLMGHSGGGALAMLLAQELPQVSRIVTLAGNLDIDAWTRHHAYTPLFSSINPADLPPLRVQQWHLLGSRDAVIPPFIVKSAIAREPAAIAIEFPGFSHSCCWERSWQRILTALQADDPALLPGSLKFKPRSDAATALDHR